MKEINKKTWQYEKHGIDGEVELFLIINGKILEKLQKNVIFLSTKLL